LSLIGVKAAYHSDLKFKSDDKSVILVDEFDSIFTENPKAFWKACQ